MRAIKLKISHSGPMTEPCALSPQSLCVPFCHDLSYLLALPAGAYPAH